LQCLAVADAVEEVEARVDRLGRSWTQSVRANPAFAAMSDRRFAARMRVGIPAAIVDMKCDAFTTLLLWWGC
jgi:hypothetical protein